MIVLPYFLNSTAALLVKQQINAKFGDKLKTGSVRVSFFTGAVVQINQISLAQAPGFGKGNLLKARGLNLRVALIPLFRKQLEIEKIYVIQPRLEIIQYQNGDTNLDYYLNRFSRNTSLINAYEAGPPIRLKRFNLVNSKIILKSYAISRNHQPTLIFNRANLILKNLVLPNPDKMATDFSGSALVGLGQPAQVSFYGTGLFGGDKVSFSAKSRITGLILADYAYLVPGSKATVKSGIATISSDMNCHNDYLNSYHHIVIKRLQLTPKYSRTFHGTLSGVPANLLVKEIQDGHGRLKFDFTLSSRLTDLRANSKYRIIQSVTRSLRDTIELKQSGNPASSGAKKVSTKFIDALKKFFSHRN
jgi:hypothetical protein